MPGHGQADGVMAIQAEDETVSHALAQAATVRLTVGESAVVGARAGMEGLGMGAKQPWSWKEARADEDESTTPRTIVLVVGDEVDWSAMLK